MTTAPNRIEAAIPIQKIGKLTPIFGVPSGFLKSQGKLMNTPIRPRHTKLNRKSNAEYFLWYSHVFHALKSKLQANIITYIVILYKYIL
ncbi:Uncharacterised protein [Mycoplasmoides gallisepticum]|uniref:Uncharacterized protein n=1 Tax=Mycoplasmoides gallisepticum TaxID=2096 RepID=A0A3B0Q5R8_MYCGL|nr:Uncharacterised protein [Mycoplasmoides gallisepticum]